MYTDTITSSGCLKQRSPQMHPCGWDFNQAYDGVLGCAGSPGGVWFTATLYDGGLPTITPYPTDGVKGQKYWRLSISLESLPLKDDKVKLYFVKRRVQSHTSQHLIAFADETKQEFFRNKNCEELNKQDNVYFYLDNDDSWMCPKLPIWTNICLTWDVDITNSDVFWDKVEKTQGV